MIAPLCLFGCATLSLPPVSSLIGGPEAQQYPDAGAVVLEDEATLEYRVMTPPGGGASRLMAVLDHRRKLKILTEAGLKEAEVRLPVDGYSTVIRVVGRAVADHRDIKDMGSDAAILTEREAVEARAPNVKDLTFHIEGAQVGGLVEYRYERVYLDPLWVGPWVYGSNLPTLRAELGVISDTAVQMDIRHGVGDHGVDRKPVRRDVLPDGRVRLVFVEVDIAGMFIEPQGVHMAHRAPWTACVPRKNRLPGQVVQRFNTWDSIAAHVRDAMALSPNQTPRHGDLRQRIGEVRAQTLPLAVPGLGVQRPDQSRTANPNVPICTREAAARAIETLGGSLPYLLLTGPQMPPFAEDFPAAYPFSRAVLLVPADAPWLRNLHCDGPVYTHDLLCGVAPGDNILFDPSCPDCPLGTLAPGFAESRALRVETDGQTHWVDVHGGGPGLHALLQNVNLVMDVDGSLRGPARVQARGTVGGRWREKLRHVGRVGGSRVQQDEQVGRINAEMLFGEAEAPRADGIRLTNLYDADQPLLAQAEVLGQATKSGFETFTVRAWDLVGSSVPAFWQGARQGAVVLGGPSWTETTVEVALPVGYVAQLPGPMTASGDVAEYAAGYSQKGRKLYFSRRLVLKQAAIAASDWSAFHDFFNGVRAYEGQSIMLQAQK